MNHPLKILNEMLKQDLVTELTISPKIVERNGIWTKLVTKEYQINGF